MKYFDRPQEISWSKTDITCGENGEEKG